MSYSKILMTLVVLFMLLACSNEEESTQDKKRKVNLKVLEPILLRSKSYVVGLTDFAKDIGYLGIRNRYRTLMLFNLKGVLLNTIELKNDGPGSVNSVINVVFDEYNREIVILHDQGIMALSLTGEIKRQCEFKSMVTIIYGFDPPRILPYRENYIVSVLHLDDINLGVGSKAFLEKVNPIKVYDKKTCECTDSIPYPEDSNIQNGIFQPTFYEPFIALDKKNNELKAVYSKIEDKLFRYDLNNGMRKLPTVDMKMDDLLFIQPIDWSESSNLQANFSIDHDNTPWMFDIICFEGFTLISYKKRKVDNDKNLYYKVFDDSGNGIDKFYFNEFDKIQYFLCHGQDNILLAKTNPDSILVEPEGTLLERVELKVK